ncbi:L-alanine exporter AlaE [Thaumasiovibrio sp. DFM-14]|uniref:L-alanine exporter AlaE n=1 Tax=Thaumasiovibrio sp. DFM-14 TaxID=3384792 RepID=UPI0039A1FABA
MKGRVCIRNAVANVFAMVLFGFVAGMAIEIFVSGMSFEQSLASRILSIPVNILIAWPYGAFRDLVIRISQRLGRHSAVKGLADFVAYVLFQSPVYALILITVGADFDQIVTAVTSNALVSGALGVVYGHFLELCRRMFRVPGYYEMAR